MALITDIISDEKPLPRFRKDLELFRGPDEEDGSPTYNLFDPIRAKYYKINWAESLVFQHMRTGMTLNDLYNELLEKTALRVEKEEIKGFYVDAIRHQLLALNLPSESMAKESELLSVGMFKWLLFHYLYIRIPLINPDNFLKYSLPFVSPLFSRPAIIFYLIACTLGVSLLISRFEEYLHTFTYFFNLEGAITYAVGIIIVKLIHEFSHAYTAKNMGIHVPTMGIALIVLWPVLYTDVTDSWRLASRRQRLAISSAGIIAEMIVAGLCTIGWAWSEPGLLQSLFFVISSVTWISTLVINLNPAVRFDGYYILCDLWRFDNLQPRAFAFTRWKLRKLLLGMHLPPPEEELSPRTQFWLVVYTCYTWIYRLFLYVAIAVFVYFQFTKALGIFLFILEVAVFIAWPIASEIYELRSLRKYLHINPRLFATFTALAILFLWFALPLPHSEKFPAITVPIEEQSLYIPEDSIVKALYVKRGSTVKKGAPLLLLASPKLNEEIITKEADEYITLRAIENASHSEIDRPLVAEKQAELATLREEVGSLRAKRDKLLLTAELTGKVYEWNEDLYPGLSLARDEVVGKIANTEQMKVVCYVPEHLLDTVHVGQTATFIVTNTHDTFQGNIEKINPSASHVLIYPQLASINAGDLPVAESYADKGAKGYLKQVGRSRSDYRLIESFYEVRVALDDSFLKSNPPLRFGMKGRIEIEGPWRSKITDGLRYVTSIFWRESGL